MFQQPTRLKEQQQIYQEKIKKHKTQSNSTQRNVVCAARAIDNDVISMDDYEQLDTDAAVLEGHARNAYNMCNEVNYVTALFL